MSSPADPTVTRSSPERRFSVLVVDDNPVALKVLSTALTRGNYDLHSASSAIEAMRVLDKNHVDLVILDIMMPGMTGLEFASSLRESNRYKNLPIVFFTAVSDQETIRSAADLGNVDYLLKPLRSRLLLERIERVLERQRQEPETASSENDAEQQGAEASAAEWQLEIPSFGVTVKKIIEVINEPDADLDQYAEVVAADPGLSSTVLRMVNSSYYGRAREVTSVLDACVAMGRRDMASVCLSAALAHQLDGDDAELVGRCWEHCVLTGALAREIATEVCAEHEGAVSIAGLLHGLGIIALLGSRGCPLAAELDRAGAPTRDWLEVEQAVLGTHHAAVGVRIGAELGLPRRVAEIIGECELISEIESLDSWCVAIGSLALQAREEHGFCTRTDPAGDLASLGERFPEAWGRIRPLLDDKVAAVCDRQRLLSRA